MFELFQSATYRGVAIGLLTGGIAFRGRGAGQNVKPADFIEREPNDHLGKESEIGVLVSCVTRRSFEFV
jgi:hypothetical protein